MTAITDSISQQSLTKISAALKQANQQYYGISEKKDLLTSENMEQVKRRFEQEADYSQRDSLARAIVDLDKAGIFTQENFNFIIVHQNPKAISDLLEGKRKEIVKRHFKAIVTHPYFEELSKALQFSGNISIALFLASLIRYLKIRFFSWNWK